MEPHGAESNTAHCTRIENALPALEGRANTWASEYVIVSDMLTRRVFGLVITLVAGALASVVAATAEPPQTSPRWTIPATAVEETNPLPANAATRAGGKKLYAAKCQRCHGPEATGNGPDADAKYADTMNLTLTARAARNADGQVFYKIWNGRLNPKMPAQSEEMTKEQVWAIVAYVQSLRTK
jgi:mono/diheme cytochrome c family protein